MCLWDSPAFLPFMRDLICHILYLLLRSLQDIDRSFCTLSGQCQRIPLHCLPLKYFVGLDATLLSSLPLLFHYMVQVKNAPSCLTSKVFFMEQNSREIVSVVNCKCLIIHSPQGFSEIIYNTGWGTLPDCLRCSLQVVKEWLMIPPYMSVKVR